MQSFRRSESAFSLTELMVVLAVIGILISLLAPALSRAKRRAREVQCMNNVRQISIEFLSDILTGSGGKWEFTGVSAWLGRNLGKAGYWACPSTPKVRNAAVNPGNNDIPVQDERWRISDVSDLIYTASGLREEFSPKVRTGSYAFNYWLSGFTNAPVAPWKGDPDFFRSEASFLNPSAVPVLGDGATWWVLPRSTDVPPPLAHSDIYFHLAMRWLCVPRHGQGSAVKKWNATKRLPGAICVGFVDGHAGVTPLEALWNLEWSANYSVPERRPGLVP